MFVIHFLPFFCFGTGKQSASSPRPAPEGSQLQISVLSGHFHPKNLQDTTLKWL